MSLLDRFPAAARFTRGDMANYDADDDDPEGAARRATIEALRSFAPDAAFPLRISVRLFGESVVDGAFDFRAAPLLKRLDQELQAVLPEGLREKAHLKFDGVGAGSVVVHARPYFGRSAQEGELELGSLNGVEAAMKSVLDLHDAIEHQNAAVKVSKERWEVLRKLTKELDAADVNLEIDMLGPTGIRRSSQISAVGRQFAREIFERKPDVVREQINGTVFGAELNGTVVLKVGGAKVEVSGVPQPVVSSEDLRLNRFVRMIIDTTVERDGVGGQEKQSRKFVRIVPATEPLPDTD